MWFKTYPPAGSDVKPAIIIPELQDKKSIISLGYEFKDLIPPGNPAARFNPATFKLAHSLNGSTWRIMPTSVVDQQNRTVAALEKLGGFYMIVASCQSTNARAGLTGVALGLDTVANLPSQEDEPEEKPLKQITAIQPELKKIPQPASSPSLLQKVINFLQGVFR